MTPADVAAELFHEAEKDRRWIEIRMREGKTYDEASAEVEYVRMLTRKIQEMMSRGGL